MSSTIAVEHLEVGMYVHLDVGWLSHPFPLSSFRITEPEEIAVIRGLGLAQVRWSPERSALPAPATPPAGAADPDHPDAADAGAAGAAASETAEDAAARRNRERLDAQREVQQQCDRQFAEAAKAWRAAVDVAIARPAEAREATRTLIGALVAKLRLSDEIGIRLVAAGGGDRPAAHALNVTIVSLLLGRALGMDDGELHDLGLGAMLHDLGKVELPDRVRHLEPGASTSEVAAYREHVAKGVALGRRMDIADAALAVLAQHHEHADASGFPSRLGGDQMTLASRIVGIANRYDNLCNPQGRVPPLTPHEAVAMVFAQGRTRHDPHVLGAFIRMMGVYPAGSLVQLTDDRFGLVVGANTTRSLKPRVLVHDPRAPRREALLMDLEESPRLGIRRSLAAARLPPATAEYLDPRPRVAYFFEPLGSAPAAVPLVAPGAALAS
ncbi:MAG: HD-GYP domain-containing protein [Pseudomonadota bacterium]|jgi:HD-GYP domain-containing protein (c-di-GMP phosphodiesterase class II)